MWITKPSIKILRHLCSINHHWIPGYISGNHPWRNKSNNCFWLVIKDGRGNVFFSQLSLMKNLFLLYHGMTFQSGHLWEIEGHDTGEERLKGCSDRSRRRKREFSQNWQIWPFSCYSLLFSHLTPKNIDFMHFLIPKRVFLQPQLVL